MVREEGERMNSQLTMHNSQLKEGYKKTKVGVIPEDWEVRKLGDFTYLRREKFDPKKEENRKYIALEHMEEGLGQINGYGNSNKTTSIKTVFKTGDVLFGKLRPYLKKYWYAQFDGVCSTEILAMKPRKGYDPKYTYYLMQQDNFINMLSVKAFGTKMPRTSWTDMKEIKFPIPPLKEQKKIATILSSVDEHIEEVDGIIEDLKELKKGLMQKLLTGQFTLENGKLVKTKEFKKAKLGMIPKHWEVKKIDNIGDLKGGSGFKTDYQGLKNSKYPFYKVSDMNLDGNNTYMVYHNNSINDDIKNKLKATLFPKHTIIFAKVGAALLLNRRRILTKNSCIDNNMMGLICNNIYYKYMYYVMCDIDFSLFVNEGAIPSVNQSQIGNIKIPIPPLQEQEKIASILSSVDERIELYENKKQDIKKLKKGLMQQLLTGKKRVLNN